MTADEVREQITGPLCRIYLIGLERGHLTASEMWIRADKDKSAVFDMGFYERVNGKPMAA